jgi:hypothetical protein
MPLLADAGIAFCGPPEVLKVHKIIKR